MSSLSRNLGYCAVILLAIHTSCSPPNEPANSDRLKFVFISTCKDEDFFTPVKKGMRDASNLFGVDCEFTGTKGVDPVAQAEMVREAIRDGVSGIARSEERR